MFESSPFSFAIILESAYWLATFCDFDVRFFVFKESAFGLRHETGHRGFMPAMRSGEENSERGEDFSSAIAKTEIAPKAKVLEK